MRVLPAVVVGLLAACDDTRIREMCDTRTLEEQEKLFEWVGQFADVSGMYDVWWVVPGSEAVPCVESDSLRLEVMPEANIQLRVCRETGYPHVALRSGADIFAARCQLDGFDPQPCGIRVGYVYSRPDTSGARLLSFKLDGDVFFSAQWSSSGEFEYGSIRTADGSLVGRICDAPRLQSAEPHPSLGAPDFGSMP